MDYKKIETFDLIMQVFPDKRPRTIRVYLPRSYDGIKRFPVLYMHDGQNLFGDEEKQNNKWFMENEMADLEKEGLSAIIVGIDNAATRMSELCPNLPINPGIYKKCGIPPEPIEPTGDLYAEFITMQLKEHIDEKYMTLPDKANTAIGGASMGGLISLYMMLKYPHIYSKALVFAPNFVTHTQHELLSRLDSYDFTKLSDNRIFMFHGGLGLEAVNWPCVRKVFETMKEKGMGEKNLALVYDSRQPHFETAWRKYFKEAFRYLFIQDNETIKHQNKEGVL